MSTHDSPFDSEQASGGFALAIGDDLIAEALAAVEAREAEARARPTESDAAEEDDEGDDTVEFVFHDEDEETDEDDELALHADAVLGDPEGLDEDGELSLDIDLFGDDGDGPAGGDDALAEVMRELEEARTALAAAEAARDEALAAAAESDEARLRARRSARKFRTGMEREASLRQRLSGTQELLRGRLARAESQLEDSEAARLSAIESLAERDARLQRATRDIERLRRREQAATAEGTRRAYERTCKELLPVLDNLQMAVDSGPGDVERFLAGVEMVLGQFVRALDRVGLTRVEATPGTLFDPSLHEAMQMVPSDDVEPGRIVSELSSGFSFEARLLRAARVIVASGPLTPPPAAFDPSDESVVLDSFSPSSDDSSVASSEAHEE